MADKAGNAFLAYSYSFVQSNVDAVAAKYTLAGVKLWQTTFDGPEAADNEQVTSLVTDGEWYVPPTSKREHIYL